MALSRRPLRRALRRVLPVLAGVSALAVGVTAPAQAVPAPRGDGAGYAQHSLRGPVTDERFYFVMADRFANGSTANDRGGLGSDPLVSGFDPTKKGFYQGGDLQGVMDHLDYVQGLGTTSIWLTPSFKNKAVQLEDGPSAGYHGYWVTDFTQIDPHLGTNAQMRQLVQMAHARGMKVYFDIITNHTADVIGYTQGARTSYVSKDASPYKDASGQPFDDRDYAEANVGKPAAQQTFPSLLPTVSFPYTPVLEPGEQTLKKPAWLNDTTLYHNRGNTTFTGEDSQYGDFFGLDDLMTENPRVVHGMEDIYSTWVRDVGIDGYRIDTMKHVDDSFWQQFGPTVLRNAAAAGRPDFFMFGEVAFDGYTPAVRAATSHYTTHDGMQSVLDFPFRDAARDYASKGLSAQNLRQFFRDDDWYTDADSNAYQLPTFLGNHDSGRIGFFLKSDNPSATDATLLAKDRLAHELMYFSRGNPVVYYGDEQGFAGTGGDQSARQTMFASQVPEYLGDDLIGTTRTHAQDNFEPSHPLYRTISQLAAVTAQNPALRNGAQQDRYAADGPGVYAFSRIDRDAQREYVVALNNATTASTATFSTWAPGRSFGKLYGDGANRIKAEPDGRITVTVPPLSAVVYESAGRIPHSKAAPAVAVTTAKPSAADRSRTEVSASVAGPGFYEVTFLASVAGGAWQPIGTDDSAPYRVFHDTSDLRPGTPVQYKAVVLDNGGHTAASAPVSAAVPQPLVDLQAPADGTKVRDTVGLSAVVDPEHATNVVTFERSVAGGPWTTVGTDSTSPAYTAVDDISALAAGTAIAYRARLVAPAGSASTSAVHTVTVAGKVTSATVRYFRPAGDYAGWGLHMWGDAVDPAVLAQIAWDKPFQATGVEDGWAVYTIPLVDDTKPVNFIMHLPSGDSVPTTREPGGDRSFTPISTPEIWLEQGDPTVYTSAPAP